MNIRKALGNFLTFPKVPPTKTIGAGGTAIWGGFIQELEKDSSLTGIEKFKTYSYILVNTTIVGAGVRYFLNLLAKPSWKVEPADESPEAQEIADFIEDAMQDMETPWHRIVRRAAMYRFYGFSVQEWTAKRRPDGKIGMADIEPRAQITIERWGVDESGTVTGVVQRSPQTQNYISIPREKLIYVVDDSLNDSPEGLGLFRHIVKASKELERFELLEGWGFETDLRGVPVGRAPIGDLQRLVDNGTISSDVKAAIEKPIRDFIVNHIKGPKLGLLLDSEVYRADDEASRPSGTYKWDMSLLQSASTSQEAVASAISRKIEDIARVLGVENLLLGAGGKGSLALSRDKSHNFYLVVDSTLSDIRSSVKKDFVDTLMKLNGWPKELAPKLKTDAIQFRDIEQITGALRDMAQAGALLSQDDPAINEVRDLVGLSHQTMPTDPGISLLGDGTQPDPNKPIDPNSLDDPTSEDQVVEEDDNGTGGLG